jgi:hypothetical protein
MSKDLAAEVRRLQREGWVVKRGTHVIVKPPGGGEQVVVANSPRNVFRARGRAAGRGPPGCTVTAG